MFFAFCSFTLCFSRFFPCFVPYVWIPKKIKRSRAIRKGRFTKDPHGSTEAFPCDPRRGCLERFEVALRSTAGGGGFWSKSTQGRQGRLKDVDVERCVQPVQPPGWFSWLLILWDFVGDYDHKEGNTTVHSIRIGHRVSNLWARSNACWSCWRKLRVLLGYF